MLDVLEKLYEHHRVRYVPDIDDPVNIPVGTHPRVSEKLWDLIAFLHAAAARAFRIKQSQEGEFSEEVLNCLQEVERTVDYLEMAGVSELWNFPEYDSYELSVRAISAKSYAELGRIYYREGRYSEALHYLARAAAASNETVFEGMQFSIMQYPVWTRHLVEMGLDNISPDDIARMFLSLQDYGQADNWSQVVTDCDIFIESRYMFGRRSMNPHALRMNSPYIDDYELFVLGDMTWGEFWHSARAWASVQLSPTDLMKLKEAEKKSASESRLRNYFFGRGWNELPDLARERLIDADRIWNSPGKASWEAIFNDLRIATEEMCHQFLWQPLLNHSGVSPTLLGMLQKELVADGRPSISNCIDVCKHESFGSFLIQRKVGDGDKEFLTKQLPEEMSRLRDNRNRAEHERGEPWHREEVRPFFNSFLAIGQPGVLSELARIGRRLRRG